MLLKQNVNSDVTKDSLVACAPAEYIFSIYANQSNQSNHTCREEVISVSVLSPVEVR